MRRLFTTILAVIYLSVLVAPALDIAFCAPDTFTYAEYDDENTYGSGSKKDGSSQSDFTPLHKGSHHIASHYLFKVPRHALASLVTFIIVPWPPVTNDYPNLLFGTKTLASSLFIKNCVLRL